MVIFHSYGTVYQRVKKHPVVKIKMSPINKNAVVKPPLKAKNTQSSQILPMGAINHHYHSGFLTSLYSQNMGISTSNWPIHIELSTGTKLQHTSTIDNCCDSSLNPDWCASQGPSWRPMHIDHVPAGSKARA